MRIKMPLLGSSRCSFGNRASTQRVSRPRSPTTAETAPLMAISRLSKRLLENFRSGSRRAPGANHRAEVAAARRQCDFRIAFRRRQLADGRGFAEVQAMNMTSGAPPIRRARENARRAVTQALMDLVIRGSPSFYIKPVVHVAVSGANVPSLLFSKRDAGE